MFANMGRTLTLLRQVRRKSQARVAKEAGIGKSQLSKYENGKELPKLESLEKVLIALKIGYPEFFYTLQLLDGMSAALAWADGETGDATAGGEAGDGPLSLPAELRGKSLLSDASDQAFSRVFTDLLLLHRRLFEHVVLSGVQDLKPSG